MLPTLRQMRAFVAVAEQLSFSRAARQLNITQPALTRMIRDLEMQVGAELLQRTTRSVRVTRPGEAFLEEAREAVVRSESAVRAARDAQRNASDVLRIGYMDSGTYGPLLPMLRVLRTEWPDLQVLLHRDRSELQSNLVATGRLDIGVTIQHPFQAGVDVLELSASPLALVMPVTHRLAALPVVPLREIRGEPLVLGEPSVWYRYLRLINDLLAREGITPQVMAEAQESPTLFRLVEAGFGLTIYPHLPYLPDLPELAFRPFVEETPMLMNYAVYRKTRLSEAGKRLLELMVAGA